MGQSYTAPDWEVEGISPSNLQSISNVLEEIVQGTDKAIHAFSLDGSVITVTYVDGTIDTFTATGLRGIASVAKTESGNLATYTITYTDGTTYSFNVKSADYTELSALTDVELTSLASGDALTFDGTKWVNSNVIGDISSALDGINGEVI